MPQISAPYNFVPLNKQVYFPEWAPFISHDVPFKEGLSGKIELKIIAESPIFIGSGKEINGVKQFCQDSNGRYFIPGSSIKGEVSNVLEILSFSKLNFYNDVIFSQREWGDNTLYDKRVFSNVKGGWLSLNENGCYNLEYSNRKIGRIKHNALNDVSKDFEENYSEENFDPNSDDMKSSKHKYVLMNLINKDEVLFKELCLEETDIPNRNRNDRRIFYKKGERVKGTLVCTGQSSANGNGKSAEFIFWKPDDSLTLKLKSDDRRIISFKTAYQDGEPSNESIDWKMWKTQLKNGCKVPVFITIENKKVKHFGLSMLYKLPYENSISELIGKVGNKNHFDNRNDLNEALFGSIENDKTKGRVHFGHCFGTNITDDLLFSKELTVVSGSPKPTFYPYYIKQNGIDDQFKVEEYLTYNDGEIAGRKRYPITSRDSEYFDCNIFKLEKSATTSSFLPIKETAEFNGTITFHNLLPVELGALLSAISFHNQNGLRHNLGFAKALGFGTIKLDPELIVKDERSISDFLCLFEKLMKINIDNWLNSEQLKELFAIATPVSQNLELLKYLKLDIDNNNDEFKDIKTEKKALPRYSVFMGVKPVINSQINIICQLSDYNYKDKLDQILSSLKTKLKKQIDCIDKKMELINHLKQEERAKEKEVLKEEQERVRVESKKKKIDALLSQGLSLELNKLLDNDLKRKGKLFKTVDTWLKNVKLNHVLSEDQSSLINKLNIVYNNLNKKETLKWQTKNDFLCKKISSWFNVTENEALKIINEKIIKNEK